MRWNEEASGVSATDASDAQRSQRTITRCHLAVALLAWTQSVTWFYFLTYDCLRVVYAMPSLDSIHLPPCYHDESIHSIRSRWQHYYYDISLSKCYGFKATTIFSFVRSITAAPKARSHARLTSKSFCRTGRVRQASWRATRWSVSIISSFTSLVDWLHRFMAASRILGEEPETSSDGQWATSHHML